MSPTGVKRRKSIKKNNQPDFSSDGHEFAGPQNKPTPGERSTVAELGLLNLNNHAS